MGKTLAEKIWQEHVVRAKEGEPDLIYIDLHLIHEVTSPQAFDGLRLSNRLTHSQSYAEQWGESNINEGVSRKLFFLKTAKNSLIMRKKLCIRTLEFY